MKRLAILASITILALSASAYDFMVNGIAYKYLNGSSGSAVEVTTNYYSYSNYSYSNYNGLTTANIPSTVTHNERSYSVTSIGGGAFGYCSGLTSVTIPNSVTSIGGDAFYDCGGLTSVTIPNSVTSIGSRAFGGTPWFDNQPDGLVYAGLVAYKYKGTMPANTSITLRDGTKGITDYAFNNCSGLTSVTIPNSVTSIGGDAFSGCSGLTSVTIGNSVTSIGGDAFSGCSGLTGELIIPNSVTSIGDGAFRYCSGLTSVTIGNSVTSIGWAAFDGCTGLTSVTIPNSVTSIGGEAFYGTPWFNNQPDGLVYAGLVAYKYKGTMPANTSITLRDGTKGIAGYAFQDCFGLTSLTIPNSITSIGSEAFSGCSGLTGALIIPNSVKVIGYKAFSGCSGLTGALIIPNSVTSISDETFSGCSGLTSVTIPNSVTEIEDFAFKDCSGLTGALIIPNSVTSIGSEAFRGCSGLTSVTIGKSVTELGGSYGPFDGCIRLKEIISKIVDVSKVRCVFENVPKSWCILKVPFGTINTYKQTREWCDFSNIQEAVFADSGTTGDLNLDNMVNGEDINIMVNYLLNKSEYIDDEGVADLDGDGKPTGFDLNRIIRIVLGE